MRFGIIGYGRFGKLWAGAIGRFGEVLVYDKKIMIPASAGMTSEIPAFAGMTTRAALAEVADVDILFLLVPISEMENCCRDIAPLLKPDVIVVDACSVKMFPAKIILELLPANQPIIATHPLFGPDSVARSGLSGHRVVVCPLRASAAQEARLLDIFRALNLKIITTTPEKHDRQMARSQALVHFIGRGLYNLDLAEQEISTPDFQALLRMNAMVQNDTLQLFLDMQTYNPFAREERQKLMRGLKEIEQKITDTAAEDSGLDGWRERINEIDAEILGLLAYRLAAVKRLSEIKKKEGRPIEDADREKELAVLHQKIGSRIGLKENFVDEIFKLIIASSKEAQEKLL